MTYDMGFVLDGLILVFLAVTIFYAARLSLFLKSFREGKNGVQLLIRDLSVTIDKAEESIKAMKEEVEKTEFDLRQTVEEARFLSDELRFMNEAGNGLAERLEKLADRNRELVDLMERSGGIGGQTIRVDQIEKEVPRKKQAIEEPFDIEDFDIDDDDERDFWALSDGAYREEEAHAPKVDTDSKSKVRSFAIFDRDFVEEDDVADYDNDEPFMSRAEQDLYDALQRKKRVRETS